MGRTDGRAYLIIVAMVRNDVNGLNDVGMLESRTNTKLRSDLFLIFALRFAGTLWAEFLDSKDTATIFAASFDEADCSTGTAPKDAAPLSIFFG